MTQYIVTAVGGGADRLTQEQVEQRKAEREQRLAEQEEEQ